MYLHLAYARTFITLHKCTNHYNILVCCRSHGLLRSGKSQYFLNVRKQSGNFYYFSTRPSHFVVMHKVGELRCFVKSEVYFHGQTVFLKLLLCHYEDLKTLYKILTYWWLFCQKNYLLVREFLMS